MSSGKGGQEALPRPFYLMEKMSVAHSSLEKEVKASQATSQNVIDYNK